MSESTLRSRVIKALSHLHAIPVENGVCPGTPDVAITKGWIELKQIAAWPIKPDTIVRCDHFTRTQRDWLSAHEAAGGLAWVLLQVGRSDFLLFTGRGAAAKLGKVCKAELYDASIASWAGNLNRIRDYFPENRLIARFN